MGDVADLVLLAACVMFAISGYRQGFVVGVLSFVGFLGGGVVGAHFAPSLHSALGLTLNPALFGVLVVFVFATAGQLLATTAGMALRRRLTWRSARTADSAGGAVVSVVSVLLVAWLIGTAVAHSSLTALARQVRHSVVLGAVDDVMPDAARTWFSSFRRLLDQNGFPQVFGAIGPERIVPVPAPDPAVLNSRAVQLARGSIVKVLGVARSCQRQLEGSGFVYAPQRVMTNAHVVAGVRSPTVQVGDAAAELDARVVLYDPRRDVAVLYVPGLGRAPLRLGGQATRGQSAVVAGYPENGPFRAGAARVRGVQEARGPDIYQRSQVTREIYAVYSSVRPGNSGGPLLAPDGSVYGVVFAAAVDDPTTGYALTAREVAPDAAAGAAATRRVSTEGCD